MWSMQNQYAESAISVSRVVVRGTTHDNSVKQAVNATVLPSGISQPAGRLNPDPNYTQSNVDVAANTGENVGVYGPGSTGVPLYCNAAWAPGDLIMADASGKGVVCTTGKYYVARAQSTGVADTYCPVDVIIGLMP